MPITLHCPHCGRTASVPESAAGKSARCKGCGAIVAIPAAPSAARPPLPVPPPTAESAMDLAPLEAPAAIEAPPPLESPATAAPAQPRFPRDRLIIFGVGGLIVIAVIVAAILYFSSRNTYSRYVQTIGPLQTHLLQIQRDLDRPDYKEFPASVREAQRQLERCDAELSPEQKEYASLQCLRSATDAYRQAADAWELQAKASSAGDTAVATSQEAAVKAQCESAAKAMNGAQFYLDRRE